MTTNTARSGWTTIRICNDCKQPIDRDGNCLCPARHPFAKGASITICEDPEMKWPIAVGTVGRIGNGAFRVRGTGDWYNITTGQQVHGPKWARPTCEGDVVAVRARNESIAKRSLVKELRLKATVALLAADTARDNAGRKAMEANRLRRDLAAFEESIANWRARETERRAEGTRLLSEASELEATITTTTAVSAKP